MDGKEADAIVRKMKEGARANPSNPRVSLGPPPQERYHRFPDGLSLCFTLDVLPVGVFWHLSIARPDQPPGPTPAEADFWRRAFFEEEPIQEIPGVIAAVNSRHFFWESHDV